MTMNDNEHNQSGSSYPTTMNTSSDLFSSAEKSQLDSFLDNFNSTDETHSNSLPGPYNSEGGRNDHYSTVTPASPTPVLLSPPFSRNSTFGQQHIQTLPILDGQQQHTYRKQSTDNSNNKREMDDNGTHPLDIKKYRLLLDDSTSTSAVPNPGSSSAFTSSTDPDHPFTAMDGTSSSSSTTTPPPSSSSIPTATATTKPKGSGRGRKPAHELLSDDQKKANHIASEQKRRANIRIGFDQLVGIVPNLSECQRSESLILHKSADYIRQLVETKNSLRDRVRELQTALGEVPDEDSSEGEMDYGF
ncbi:hypothetical protein BCR42DRAFT_418294 [Absidia repens]|uniref:BHLH domain-containing protein n=1 Tax=Absidia repens TaxID=90262 RepID=A0A1X2ID63_9FUNG|nr:hypothetical protein BCR42DRAFT_418294 [Absidia repens]